jgi:hypothetical protein
MNARCVLVAGLCNLRFLAAILVVPCVVLAAGLANGQEVPAAEVELVIEAAPAAEQPPAAEPASGFSLFKAVVDAVVSPLVGNSAADSANSAGTTAVAIEAEVAEEEGPPQTRGCHSCATVGH